MKARTAARLAWGLWAILTGLAILLQSATTEGFPAGVMPALALGAFVTVGAVVVSRQPRNTVGWLCCAAGLLGSVAGFATEYAGYALGSRRAPLPSGLVMAWLTLWVGFLWVGLTFTFRCCFPPAGSRRGAGARSPGPARPA
jgi:hypothetical protein